MDKTELITLLKYFKQQLITKYRIKRLILFGSYSKGDSTEESDVDLIVVGEFEGKGNFQRAPQLYKEWHLIQNIDIPVDFICYTPEEFDGLKTQISLVKEALEEGIEI